MALTRKALKAMNIEGDQADQIIQMHSETVDALKEEIEKYKADAEKLPGLQKKVDDLEAQVAKNGDENEWKSKYEKEHQDFEDYKKADQAKEIKAKKTEAYKQLLIEAGISPKRIDAVLKISGDQIEAIVLDEEGKAKDADKLMEGITKEWEGFITTEGSKGAESHNPPGNTGGSDSFADMTLAEKMEYANEHPGEQAIKDWLANPVQKKEDKKE